MHEVPIVFDHRWGCYLEMLHPNNDTDQHPCAYKAQVYNASKIVFRKDYNSRGEFYAAAMQCVLEVAEEFCRYEVDSYSYNPEPKVRRTRVETYLRSGEMVGRKEVER